MCRSTRSSNCGPAMPNWSARWQRCEHALSWRCCPFAARNQVASAATARSRGPAASVERRPTAIAGRRGRRPAALTAVQRLQLAQVLKKRPKWGLPRLRRQIPDLPKNATATYIRRAKSVLARRRRRNWRQLDWHVPGAVWAIDGTWMDRPVDGRGRRALVVVELHSRKTLALSSVAGERAPAVIALLTKLIARHGAPLVLKADNGSAFTARSVAIFCQRHGITLLHSPVRRPRWNGTCEVSGRWAKKRTTEAMLRRGSATLSQCDLDAAVGIVEALPPVDAVLRAHFAEVVVQQLHGVAVERGLAIVGPLRDHARRSLERVAIQRALQLCHILTIRGRAYQQWLPAPAA